MITMYCTKKLLENSLFIEEQNDEPIDEFYMWHANMFRMAKKNNIIFMNNKTRYCFMLFGVKKEHYKNFKQLFINSLRDNLESEEYPDHQIDQYISNINQIKFTKNYDRRVMGSMVDMVKMASFIIDDYLPIQEMNIIYLNKDINDNPILKLNNSPDRLMREALGG